MPNSNEPLASLQKALTSLVEQAQAYERALPHNNYAARAAVAALLKLAKQAQSEAVSLAETLPDHNQQLNIPSHRASTKS